MSHYRRAAGAWALASVAACSLSVQAAGFIDELDGLTGEYATAPAALSRTDRDLQPAQAGGGFASPALEVIASAEMAELRGGFAINGLDLAFGARLRAMIDDVMQQTLVEFSESGPRVVAQTLVDPTHRAQSIQPANNRGGVSVTMPTPPTLSTPPSPVPSSGASGGGVSVTAVTPPHISLPGMSEFAGVALNDTKGFTAVLHQITQQAIIGSVVSSANDRTISSHIDVDITVNNMEALRSLGAQARILNELLR